MDKKISEKHIDKVRNLIRSNNLQIADGYIMALGFNTMIQFYEAIIKQDGICTGFIFDLTIYYMYDTTKEEREMLFKSVWNGTANHDERLKLNELRVI